MIMDDSMLRKAAVILHEYGQFVSVKAALDQLTSDYPKGYPSYKWIEGLLDAYEKKHLLVVTWDNNTGNYNWMGEKP